MVSALFQGEPAAGELVTRYTYRGVPVVCIDKNKVPHSRVKETYYQAEMRPVLRDVLRAIRPDIVHVTHLINHTAALLEVTGELGIATYATFTDFFGVCLNNKLEAADGALCVGPSRSRVNCIACHFKAAAGNSTATGWIRYATSPVAAGIMAVAADMARRLPGLRRGPLDGMLEDITRRPDTLATLYNTHYLGAVAPTRFLAEAYAANGIAVPMRKIWFGVDIDRAGKPARNVGARPTIGYIGQLAPHKGVDLLVEAFSRLPRDAADLRIFGPEGQDPQYSTILRQLAGNHSVRFLGTFDNEKMSTILGQLDLIVIPSRWFENSPLVLLNALATHTPVLVSNVAGMTEFLDNARVDETFDRGSVDHLEQQLRRLLLRPNELFNRAKEISYDRTTSSMATDTLAIYESRVCRG